MNQNLVKKPNTAYISFSAEEVFDEIGVAVRNNFEEIWFAYDEKSFWIQAPGKLKKTVKPSNVTRASLVPLSCTGDKACLEPFDIRSHVLRELVKIVGKNYGTNRRFEVIVDYDLMFQIALIYDVLEVEVIHLTE